jgi:hypothetical protein
VIRFALPCKEAWMNIRYVVQQRTALDFVLIRAWMADTEQLARTAELAVDRTP